MREAIETVPSDGRFVILEDESSGSFAVARWSDTAGDWVGETGWPIKIAPTHWHPVSGNQSHPQESNESGAPAPPGPAQSRRRRFGLFPFSARSARRAAPRQPVANDATASPYAKLADAIEAFTVPVKSKRAPQARRHVVALSLATVVVAALIGMSFRADVVAYLRQYARLQDIVRTGAPDVPLTVKAVQAAERTTVELRQSMQGERDRAATLAQDLAAARREIDAHMALASKAGDDAAQLKQITESTARLQQERERAEALVQSLATARRELAIYTALAGKAGDDTAQARQTAESTTAELRQSLQQERDRAEALAQDLATARREIDAHTALAGKASDEAAQIKRAAENTTTELRQSLQQERNRAEVLAQSLATAQREIDKHTALASKAGDDAAQTKQAAESTTAELRQSLQQERDRAEELAQELATARREIETHTALGSKAGDDAAQIRRAAESTAAELRQSLQRERDRAEALAQDLARARREIDMFAALSARADDDAAQVKRAAESTTAELQKSVQQERDRAEALAQNLATARGEIDKYAALASKAGDDAALITRAAEGTMAELRRSLQQERTRAEALARDLESARRLADQRNAPEPMTVAQVKQVVETVAVEQPAARSQDSPDVARLLLRASVLLDNGNIGAARIVLEHATATGSARASFALAETYDPLVLSTWGTFGTRGDPTRARELYAKAHAGGIKNAQERLNALQQ
jgi:DNA-binding ferritin-like protein (Dps family)